MKQTGKREAAPARSKTYGKVLTIMAIVMVLSCFAGGIFARYMRKDVLENNQVEAEAFYFTVDLIRDDTMTDVTKEYHLYGGGAKDIKFNVWNYVDDLRVTAADVEHPLTYTFACSHTGDGSYADTSYKVLNSADDEVTGASFAQSKAEEHAYTLKIGEGYKDGTVLTLNITSTAPYAKTISLVFHLHTADADVMYRVEDEADSNTASLIVMANVDIPAGHIQLDLTGVNDQENMLQVDMTDNDIWNAGGPPTVPAGQSWLTTVTVTKGLKAGESLEILFFKANPQKNYQTDPLGSGLENKPLVGANRTITLAEYAVSSGS